MQRKVKRGEEASVEKPNVSGNDQIESDKLSRIFKGKKLQTNELVAIKVVNNCQKDSLAELQLLSNSMQILKKIEHPNILKCFDSFEMDRNFYIITEFCNEGDLASKRVKKGRFTQPEIRHYLDGILQGLLYLSGSHIVHHHIKLSNIFIHNGQPKIADYRLTRKSTHKFYDIKIGSSLKLPALEDVNNGMHVTKTDVWAFGVLVYEMLHGEGSFSDWKRQEKVKEVVDQLNSRIFKVKCSEQLQEVVLKCLSVNCQKRITPKGVSQLSYFKNVRKDQFQINLLQPKLNKMKSTGFIQKASYMRLNPVNSMKIDKPVNLQPAPRNNSRVDIRSKQGKGQYQFQLLTEPTMTEIVSSDSDEHTNQLKQSISAKGRGKYQGSWGTEEKKGRDIKIQLPMGGSLSEQQSLYIVHYCRLLGKCIKLMRMMNYKEESQLLIIKRWPLILLSSLRTCLKQQSVTSIQGESKLLPQQKSYLLHLIKQYMSRYQRQYGFQYNEWLKQTQPQLTYRKMISYLQGIKERLEMQSRQTNPRQQLLELGQYIIVAYESTKALERSTESKQYKLEGNFDQLLKVLKLNTEQINLKNWKNSALASKS